MKQSRTAVRASAVIVALGALTMSGTAAQASPMQGESGGKGTSSVCGFYEDATFAWYNHCATNTFVWVFIERVNPNQSNTVCLGPRTSRLGTAASISNAWYVGRTC